MGGGYQANQPLCRRTLCGGLTSRHAVAQDHPAIRWLGISKDGGSISLPTHNVSRAGSTYRVALRPQPLEPPTVG